jgi:TolB-like protein
MVLADGFAADLAAGLSKVADLAVISWQSSQQASGRVDQAAESAEALAAQYAVTGSIRSLTSTLRVSAQLIHTASREWIWADRYDVPLDALFDLQDTIVERILGGVDASVRQAEREHARQRALDNLDAWGFYHRGMWHLYRFTLADLESAEKLLQEAMARAPAAAPPHAALAYASIVRAQWFFTDDIVGTLRHGLATAHHAVSLDSRDAQARTILGRLLTLSGEMENARQHLRLAIELNWSLAHAHYGLALATYYAGQPAEAIMHVDTAIRLSPRDPLVSGFTTLRAYCCFVLGREEEAEFTARRAVSLNDRESFARLALAAILYRRGKQSEAREAVAEARRIQPRLSLQTFTHLVRHVPADLREQVLAPLRSSGFS